VKSEALLFRRKREHTLIPLMHSVDTRRQKSVVEECTRLLDGSTGKLVYIWHMSYEKLVRLPDNEPSADAAHGRIQRAQ